LKQNKFVQAKNSKYVWMPGERYYEKLFRIADLVETTHLIDVPDDDIILKSFLKDANLILKSNKSINLVTGQTVRFTGEFPLKVKILFEKQREYTEQPTKTFQNLNYFFESFFVLNHAVCRKEIFQKISTFVLNNPNLKPVKFFDKIFAFICICEGNVLVLNQLSHLRRNDDRMISSLKNYPVELERHVEFSSICERLVSKNPFISLIKNGNLKYQDDFIHKFIYDLFRNIKYFNENQKSPLLCKKSFISQFENENIVLI
jgi:hypothetical protein